MKTTIQAKNSLIGLCTNIMSFKSDEHFLQPFFEGIICKPGQAMIDNP